VPHEPGQACGDRMLGLARAPVLLGQRGERDGRRIGLDPASELLNACGVDCHGVGNFTETEADFVPFFPESSVTVRTTT